MNEAVRIHGLEVENFKRIKFVRLAFSPSGLTVIGGRNGQGKSSVLDAIAAALGGAKKIPTNLKRENGIADPRVKIELENGLVIERKGKNFDLHIRAKDGSKAGQKTLDSIIDEFAIDLPKFMAAKSSEKAESLLKLLGIGERLNEFDREEQAAYNEREYVGRQARQKEAHAKELVEYPDVPEELQSTADLMLANKDLLERNVERQHARTRLAELHAQKTRGEDRVNAAKIALQKAQADLLAIICDLEKAEAVEITPEETDAEIKTRLSEIEATNAKIRSNLDKAKAKDDAKLAQAEYDKLTVKIEDVRKRRAALLESAAMPLPGLTVEKGELLYNGKAWDCMATSEQIKISVAIAHALKPSCCFVLLDRMESFDPETLRELDVWLAELGMQGIATRVSTGKECAVVIEDGMIDGQEETAIAAEQVEAKEEPNAYEEGF